MSSKTDGIALGRSLALRLGLWQALLFGVGTAIMFVAVYLFLARTLADQRTAGLGGPRRGICRNV